MAGTDTSAAVDVLRAWIDQALLSYGYSSVTGTSPSQGDGTHGMYSPVEYTLHDKGGDLLSTLILQGLVVGKMFMLYCERSIHNDANASTSTWRVDFPLARYAPALAGWFPRYQELVAWRVQNSIVRHGSHTAQALLPLLPSLCIDSIVSFLNAASLCAIRATNKMFYQYAMASSMWELQLRRDFPRTTTDSPSFAAYANACITRKRNRHLRNRAIENMLWFDRESGPAYAQRWLAPPPAALLHIPRLPFEAPSP
ncbi:hypothetical protein H310_06969 [Aphanomyces invadans]|uniref:F-box domain-containing protein n=1 Tax=Aphanomyces invadans TaxID=157072 RepID=A0A024U5H7_9STRA|nr:hypothetical protein H310_06969 [Aphanomyces invadans]ETW01455.1 hypothetical protein H310_06969 [Aphanomyces invadans]|eukprot:XP_008870453.1 hypothetical protein H310_06969 [Aphanomyces invadans]